MRAMTLVDTLRYRPAALLIGLGLISGSLSAAWGETFTLGGLQPLGWVFLLDPAALPIGFFYGAALGLGMALAMRKTWAVILVPVTTMYAWSAAVHTAIRLQRNSGDDAHLVVASLCAGAVGAGLTHLGCALFASELRWPSRVCLTCTVGAAAGMLFFMGERKMVDERLLYLIWQPVVAFSIGLWLPRPYSAP
ncbi:MAG: hypothetical protein J2P51_03485 [Hyphomicrobiaceae bacterium]|nr:hypothetical protein [Hyphomicrobiaceae bacterium]